MCKYIILFLFTVFTCSLALTLRSTPNRYSCGTIKLAHGRVKYRQKGRFARFQCNTGYVLVGEKYSMCVKNKWESPLPFCVRPTCSKVSAPLNGLIFPAHLGAVMNFYCKHGFSIRGSSTTYCDGTKWSSNLPTCVATNAEPAFSCDFETDDLCGWNHDLNHDFDWRRQNFKTPSGHIGTGPSFDHTKGPGNDGYYVYIESSSRLENDTARLISPVYTKMENGFCFKFFYHMYGLTTGKLKVYIKKENDTSDTRKLQPLFNKSGNQGDKWYKGLILIPSMDQDFQIIIEGVRGASYISDIAIDDVSLLDSCQDEIDTSANTEDSDFFGSTMTPIIYDSCENRCDMESENDTYSCECIDNCLENNTCCPDYTAICVLGQTDYYTESTVYSTDLEFSTTEVPTSFNKNFIYNITNNPVTKLLENSTKSIEPITQKITNWTNLPTKVTKITPKIKNIALLATTEAYFVQSIPQEATILPKATVTKIIEKFTKIIYVPAQKITAKVPQILPNTTLKTTSKITRKPTPKTIKTTPKTTPRTTPKTTLNTTLKITPVTKKITQIFKKTTQIPKKATIPTKIITKPTQTVKMFTKADTKYQNEVIKPNRPIVKTTYLPEDFTQGTLEVETDFFTTLKSDLSPQNDKQMSLATTIEDSTSTKLVVGVVGSLVFVMLVILVVILVVRRYDLRMFGGFRGYRGSKHSDSLSDVRFLASDEVLDFSMRSVD